MEIEAKLIAPSREVLHRVSALGEVCGYRVAARREHHIRDIYFDTPERTLHKHDSTLRLRLIDGSYYATFKARNRAAGAVHCREEVEERLPGRRAFREASGAPLPCQRARELAAGEPLRPTLIVRNHRRVMQLAREDGGSIRLMLDHVTFAGKGGRKAFHEIEIEGEGEEDRAALEEVAGWLRARFPLTPSGPSKYSTGLALLDCP